MQGFLWLQLRLGLRGLAHRIARVRVCQHTATWYVPRSRPDGGQRQPTCQGYLESLSTVMRLWV